MANEPAAFAAVIADAGPAEVVIEATYGRSGALCIGHPGWVGTKGSMGARRRTAPAVMTSMVEVFRSGDISAIRASVSDGYVDHQGVGSGEIVGPDGFGFVVEVARRSFETLEVSIEDLFAEDDRAVARLRWRGTRTSGEVVERETIDIVRVVEGLAVEHWGAESWSTSHTAV